MFIKYNYIKECFEIFLKNFNFFFFYNNFFYNNFFYLKYFPNIFFFYKFKDSIKSFNIKFIHSIDDKFLLNKHLKYNIFFFKFYSLININIKNPKRLDFIKFDIYYKFYKFFNIFLYNFFLQNNKLLLLDNKYKNAYSFLSNLYSSIDIINYSTFFFPNASFFTRKTWIFLFESFCKSFSISLFILLNYKIFEKHFYEIYNLEIPVVSLSYLDNYNNINLPDYFFFYNLNNTLYYNYLLLYSLNNIYFISFNIKNFLFKKKYLYFFWKFFKNL